MSKQIEKDQIINKTNKNNQENKKQMETKQTAANTKPAELVFLIKNAYAKFASIDAETGAKKTPTLIFKVNDFQKVFITLKEGSFIGASRDDKNQYSIRNSDITKIVGYTQSIKPVSANSKFKPSAIKEELNSYDLSNFKDHVVTMNSKKFFESLKSNKNEQTSSSKSSLENLADVLKDVSLESSDEIKSEESMEIK